MLGQAAAQREFALNAEIGVALKEGRLQRHVPTRF